MFSCSPETSQGRGRGSPLIANEVDSGLDREVALFECRGASPSGLNRRLKPPAHPGVEIRVRFSEATDKVGPATRQLWPCVPLQTSNVLI